MKKYKNSIYNLLVEKNEDGALLYNSHSGALFMIDNITEKFLTTIGDNTEPEKFVHFNSLLENGYIVDENVDEAGFLK